MQVYESINENIITIKSNYNIYFDFFSTPNIFIKNKYIFRFCFSFLSGWSAAVKATASTAYLYRRRRF